MMIDERWQKYQHRDHVHRSFLAPMAVTPTDLTAWAEQILALDVANLSREDRTELIAEAAVQMARRVVGEEER
jgi:hypothetical protein